MRDIQLECVIDNRERGNQGKVVNAYTTVGVRIQNNGLICDEGCCVRENCIFRTSNITLRSFAISNIDIVKLEL